MYSLGEIPPEPCSASADGPLLTYPPELIPFCICFSLASLWFNWDWSSIRNCCSSWICYKVKKKQNRVALINMEVDALALAHNQLHCTCTCTIAFWISIAFRIVAERIYGPPMNTENLAVIVLCMYFVPWLSHEHWFIVTQTTLCNVPIYTFVFVPRLVMVAGVGIKHWLCTCTRMCKSVFCQREKGSCYSITIAFRITWARSWTHWHHWYMYFNFPHNVLTLCTKDYTYH